jgi:hypothetical protein
MDGFGSGGGPDMALGYASKRGPGVEPHAGGFVVDSYGGENANLLSEKVNDLWFVKFVKGRWPPWPGWAEMAWS